MILPKVILRSHDTLVSGFEGPQDGFFSFSSGGYLVGVTTNNLRRDKKPTIQLQLTASAILVWPRNCSSKNRTVLVKADNVLLLSWAKVHLQDDNYFNNSIVDKKMILTYDTYSARLKDLDNSKEAVTAKQKFLA